MAIQIENIQVFPPEANNSFYVTYYFVSDEGDKVKFGPTLEPENTDVDAKAEALKASAMRALAQREREENLLKIKKGKEKPEETVYKYNNKNDALNLTIIEDIQIEIDYHQEAIDTLKKSLSDLKKFLGVN